MKRKRGRTSAKKSPKRLMMNGKQVECGGDIGRQENSISRFHLSASHRAAVSFQGYGDAADNFIYQ